MSDRFKPGQIRDAICGFLGERQTHASVAEIHAAASARLNKAIPASSIRSYLRLNTPGLFERKEHGSYLLANGVSSEGATALPEEKTRAVYRRGRSQLILGNCLDWLRKQPERTIHAVVTDPPYGLVEYSPKEQQKLRSGRGGVWRIPPAFDGHQRSPLPRFTVMNRQELEKLAAFFGVWARALFPVLVPGANVVVAANPLLSYLVAAAVVDAGFERRGEIVRLVMTMRGGDRPKNAHNEFPDVSVMPRSMWEPWLLFRKPLDGRVQDNLRRWKTGGFRRVGKNQPFGDVIPSAPTHASERKLAPHPSLKPQSFMRPLVRAVLPLGKGIVLDPFAGAASTLAAAEAVGYESIGIELDPRYFEMGIHALSRLGKIKTPMMQEDTPSLFETA